MDGYSIFRYSLRRFPAPMRSSIGIREQRVAIPAPKAAAYSLGDALREAPEEKVAKLDIREQFPVERH